MHHQLPSRCPAGARQVLSAMLTVQAALLGMCQALRGTPATETGRLPAHDFMCGTGRLNLAAHPHAQQQVAQELAAAGLLCASPTERPRELAHADLSKLPFLDAVC